MYLPKTVEQKPVIETLPNQLKVAIIRSDDINAPIISISVAVGHYHETTQCYGFSHLLEHMIFHRSKNFNSSEALEKHVSKFSGYINGWTHACHTNFHLSCAKEGFVEAVKMLSDKIAHPSFAIADIQTEISAIDEEYRLKLEDPIRGFFSVKKALANPAHPFHRFTVGNRDTLGEKGIDLLQQQLCEHHQKYFHSGNISVCIKVPNVGEYENDLLNIKETLTYNIAELPSNHALTLPDLYLPEMNHKWVNLQLKHSYCQLVLCWLVTKTEPDLDENALKMVRQLIESKHKNGLFDTLNSQHLIRSLSITGGIEQPKLEEIQLHITLSNTGLKNQTKVLALVSGFMEFLSRSQLAHWRFNELEKQNQLLDQFAHRKDPVETCINAAQSLHAHGSEHEPYSIHQAKERISSILNSLKETPHHAYYIDENAEANALSDFYHVPYSITQIPSIEQDQTSHFMLAPQNAYIAKQLLLVTPEIATGSVEEINQHGVLLKFAQVVKQNQPTGDCFISINSPAMCDSLAHSMSKKIWVEGFTDYLQKRFYQAIDAGIGFRVYGHQHGVTIHTTGFSEKQLLLAIEIVNCMIAFKLNEDEFKQGKQSILKRLTTRLLQKPINQLFANLNTLIQGDTYFIGEQVSAVDNLSFQDLNAHQSKFFQQTCVEALLVGNWRKHAAQKMHQQLQSRLITKGIWQKPAIAANSIPLPILPTLPDIKANDTAIVLYQQVRQLDQEFVYIKEHATAICLLLEHILGPHIFLRLRKDKQLAYLVGVGYKPINMQPGIAIYLQSSKACAGEMYEAIVEVLTELIENWQVTERDIEQSKHQVAEQCEPLNKDISNIARRLWANYEHQNAYFHYKIQQNAVTNVQASEIKNWLYKLRQASEGQILLTNDQEAPQRHALSKFTHRPLIN